MVGMQNNDQRYKVIDRGDLMEFLQEDMIDQLRGGGDDPQHPFG